MSNAFVAKAILSQVKKEGFDVVWVIPHYSDFHDSWEYFLKINIGSHYLISRSDFFKDGRLSIDCILENIKLLFRKFFNCDLDPNEYKYFGFAQEQLINKILSSEVFVFGKSKFDSTLLAQVCSRICNDYTDKFELLEVIEKMDISSFVRPIK